MLHLRVEEGRCFSSTGETVIAYCEEYPYYGARPTELSPSRYYVIIGRVQSNVRNGPSKDLTARFRFEKLYLGGPMPLNARMSDRDVKRLCRVDDASGRLIEMAMEKLGLSARAYTRILKVARTIADLDGLPEITASHVAEAIQYRSLDRRVI